MFGAIITIIAGGCAYACALIIRTEGRTRLRVLVLTACLVAVMTTPILMFAYHEHLNEQELAEYQALLKRNVGCETWPTPCVQ